MFLINLISFALFIYLFFWGLSYKILFYFILYYVMLCLGAEKTWETSRNLGIFGSELRS